MTHHVKCINKLSKTKTELTIGFSNMSFSTKAYVIIHSLPTRKPQLREAQGVPGGSHSQRCSQDPTLAKPGGSLLHAWGYSGNTPDVFGPPSVGVLGFLAHLPGKQRQCSRKEAYLSPIWKMTDYCRIFKETTEGG